MAQERFSNLTPDCCSLGDMGDEPGVWDTVTSWFSSSESQPAPTASNTEVSAVPAPNPDEMYSKYFSLRDLTVTSLPHPNLPLDKESQDNLRKLGTLLDAIRDNIGDFVIASAYRSPENQEALRQGAGGTTAAKMAAKKSYHSSGAAADITPKNGMNPTQFAQAIYLNPLTKVLIGQIVDKSGDGGETSLHISIPTSKFPKATPMYVVSGQYYRMTEEQISNWLSSSMPKEDIVLPQESFSPIPDEAVSEEELDDVQAGQGLSPQVMVGIVAGLALAYFLYTQQSKKQRPALT